MELIVVAIVSVAAVAGVAAIACVYGSGAARANASKDQLIRKLCDQIVCRDSYQVDRLRAEAEAERALARDPSPRPPPPYADDGQEKPDLIIGRR